MDKSQVGCLDQWWVLTYHLWGQGCDHQHNMKPVTLTHKSLFLRTGKYGGLFMVVRFMCSFPIIVTHIQEKQIKGLFFLAYCLWGFREAMAEQHNVHYNAKTGDTKTNCLFLCPTCSILGMLLFTPRQSRVSYLIPFSVLLIHTLTVCVIIPQRLLNPITVILNVICHIWGRKQDFFFLFVTTKYILPLFKLYKYKRNMSQNCNFKSPREETSSEYENIYINIFIQMNKES